jgi:hypothetical protein
MRSSKAGDVAREVLPYPLGPGVSGKLPDIATLWLLAADWDGGGDHHMGSILTDQPPLPEGLQRSEPRAGEFWPASPRINLSSIGPTNRAPRLR